MAAAVSLSNLSRPGAADIQLSERWAIQITGATPGGTVSLSRTISGGAPTVYTFGTVTADGAYTILGTMGTADIGAWLATWRVDGVDISPVLSFSVQPYQVQATEDAIYFPEALWIWGFYNLVDITATFDWTDGSLKTALPMTLWRGLVAPADPVLGFNKESTSRPARPGNCVY